MQQLLQREIADVSVRLQQEKEDHQQHIEEVRGCMRGRRVREVRGCMRGRRVREMREHYYIPTCTCTHSLASRRV